MNRSIRVIAVLTIVFASFAVHAETWPSRMIKATIPFGAGSAADVVPRLLFDRLAVELGQPIVIENRAGAGGTVGSGMVAKADPDGYSILSNSNALTIAPAIFPNLAFDAARDRISLQRPRQSPGQSPMARSASAVPSTSAPRSSDLPPASRRRMCPIAAVAR
jgi:tripartite-type tricarboxylate transporter receptor subunit TctC